MRFWTEFLLLIFMMVCVNNSNQDTDNSEIEFWRENIGRLQNLFGTISIPGKKSNFGLLLRMDDYSFHSPDEMRGKSKCFKYAQKFLDSIFQFHIHIKIEEYIFNSSDLEIKKTSENICFFHYDSATVQKVVPHGPHNDFIGTNLTGLLEGLGLDLKHSTFCEVPPEYRCNRQSQCSTDECGCENVDVFFCRDGSGCIAFDNVCDLDRDCTDGSDESLCEGVMSVQCPSLVPYTIHVSPHYICRNSEDFASTCPEIYHDVNCTELYKGKDEYGTPIEECLVNILLKEDSPLRDSFTSSGELDVTKVSRVCNADCGNISEMSAKNWTKFCNKIYSGSTSFHIFLDFVFNCEGKPFESEAIPIGKLCDGTSDCSNNADEDDCPNRFYCQKNTSIEWVPPEKVCDNIKDCSNGKDECQECGRGALASSRYLISSNVVLALTFLGGTIMILLNCFVGHMCYQKTPQNRPGKVDRLLCLQVFFFDGLVGLYNCSIAVASVVIARKGDYCLFDQDWRGSVYCSILGVIFSVATHGSLLAIAFISTVRCLICTGKIQDIENSTVYKISAFLIFFNLANALAPVLPFDEVQDVFRTNILFTHLQGNPFISSNPVNRTRLDELHFKYYSHYTNLHETVRNLNNITSNEEIFNIVEIGYYGNTEMCIHNVFNTQSSYIVYKHVYFAVIFMLLVILSITYIAIILEKLSLQRRLAQAGGNRPADQNISSLGIKVVLMIGSQTVSWVSFIATAIYHQSVGEIPGSATFEIFALLVIPINSLLNPIFYSKLYSRFAALLLKVSRTTFSKVLTCNKAAEDAADEQEEEGNENVPKAEDDLARNQDEKDNDEVNIKLSELLKAEDNLVSNQGEKDNDVVNIKLSESLKAEDDLARNQGEKDTDEVNIKLSELLKAENDLARNQEEKDNDEVNIKLSELLKAEDDLARNQEEKDNDEVNIKLSELLKAEDNLARNQGEKDTDEVNIKLSELLKAEDDLARNQEEKDNDEVNIKLSELLKAEDDLARNQEEKDNYKVNLKLSELPKDTFTIGETTEGLETTPTSASTRICITASDEKKNQGGPIDVDNSEERNHGDVIAEASTENATHEFDIKIDSLALGDSTDATTET